MYNHELAIFYKGVLLDTNGAELGMGGEAGRFISLDNVYI